MKYKFVFVLILALSVNMLNFSDVYGQRTTYEISELGIFPDSECSASAKVSCNPALKTVESGLIEAAKKRRAYGYSVQIFFESGVEAKNKADKVVEDFKKNSGCDDEAYVFYEAPYFKVRVGDCRSRLEATKLKKAIEAKYPGCFIIECRIAYPKL